VIEAASREPAATTTFEANEWLPTGERVTRAAVTAIMALIALLTFAFSFGNIWALGLSLGVSPWIAPLVGPAADLSVVGLLVAVRYLSLRGVDGRHLRPARFLLAVTGVATLTLNVAWPVAHRAYGRAAFDAVGPLLLIGWAEVGPGLLRHIHAVRTSPGPDRSGRPPAEDPAKSAERVRTGSPRARQAAQTSPARARPDSGKPRRRARGRDEDGLLTRTRQIDRQHRARHGRPVSADTLRRELRVGSALARHLVAVVRGEATHENTSARGSAA